YCQRETNQASPSCGNPPADPQAESGEAIQSLDENLLEREEQAPLVPLEMNPISPPYTVHDSAQIPEVPDQSSLLPQTPPPEATDFQSPPGTQPSDDFGVELFEEAGADSKPDFFADSKPDIFQEELALIDDNAPPSIPPPDSNSLLNDVLSLPAEDSAGEIG